jgi:hypothetical protein
MAHFTWIASNCVICCLCSCTRSKSAYQTNCTSVCYLYIIQQWREFLDPFQINLCMSWSFRFDVYCFLAEIRFCYLVSMQFSLPHNTYLMPICRKDHTHEDSCWKAYGWRKGCCPCSQWFSFSWYTACVQQWPVILGWFMEPHYWFSCKLPYCFFLLEIKHDSCWFWFRFLHTNVCIRALLSLPF